MSSAKRRLRPMLDLAAEALVSPLVLAYRIGFLGFSTVSLSLAVTPGQAGRFVRRAWYARTLASCGRNLVVDFGAAIRTPRTRVGNDCYIGLWNWIGWVDLGDHFMSGSHVVIMSGSHQHGYARLDLPMARQQGELRCVTIGEDVWVGALVAISADVSPHSVVGSGAVVTRTHQPHDILGGVPAKPIGTRRGRAAS